MIRKTFLPALFLLVAVVGCDGKAAASPPIAGLLFFGDSYTDTGNAYALTGGVSPPSPPYMAGRFCEGPAWPDYLPEHLGQPTVPVLNHAVGGAGSGLGDFPRGTLGQVADHLAIHPTVPADWVVLLYIGTNDYGHVVYTIPPPNSVEADTALTLGNIESALRQLHAAGGQRFVVPNLPPLWTFPYARSQPQGAINLRQRVELHNAQLGVLLGTLSAELGAEFLLFDSQQLYLSVIANPSAYGFVDVLNECTLFPDPTLCASPSTTLFFDYIHVNTRAHELFSLGVAEILNPPTPSNATGWLGW